jgi:nucleoside-diphosphate-sugar epimerase
MNNMDIIYADAERVIGAIDLGFFHNKRVLITGATGLLGAHFLAVLSLLKTRVYNIGLWGMYHSSPADSNQVKFIKDIPFGEFDVIIHAAGYAQPSVFTANPAETIRINTELTRRLLDHLAPGGKFLFVSSSEVYSGLGGLVTESSIGTTTPSHPRSCYIEGKRCGEAIVNAYRAAGVDAKSARLSLAYGPGTRAHDKRAMSVFIEQALTKGHIELKYSGREPRMFCYVSDAVEMMFQILLRGNHPVYNVGGDSLTNMAGVALQISQLTGAQLTIPQDETTMPGAPLVVTMDKGLYFSEFGFKKFIDMEDGLKRTIEWQRGLYAPSV